MRIIKFLLLGALSVILLLILSVILAVTTSTGTKYTLSLVEHFSGIRIQGVSGSLIRQFNIQHVELHHKDIDLVMDDVALQWQPKALFDR